VSHLTPTEILLITLVVMAVFGTILMAWVTRW
jgi:hypothetical protein